MFGARVCVEVQVRFAGGETETWFVWVHPHPDWWVTNMDALNAIYERAKFRSIEFMMARGIK